MKIRSLTGLTGYSHQVRGRSERQNHPDENAKDQRNPQQDSSADENSESEFQEKLEKAIQAFGNDSQTQANGIKASVTGAGPGLRVILTDLAGGVVRQLTREEFMKLHDSAPSGDAKIRGKILDQKL